MTHAEAESCKLGANELPRAKLRRISEGKMDWVAASRRECTLTQIERTKGERP